MEGAPRSKRSRQEAGSSISSPAAPSAAAVAAAAAAPAAYSSDFDEYDGPIDLVLSVVTPVEWQAVYDLMKPFEDKEYVLECLHDKLTYYLGKFGIYKAALVQQHSMGCESAKSTVGAAITKWNPQAVVAIGIAGGLQEARQDIGDVIVSQRVGDYEKARAQDLDERIECIPRGSIVDAPLHGLFLESTTSTWKFERAKVCKGLLLSGPIVLDSLPLALALLEIDHFREAQGCEMESFGVYSASSTHKVDWVVVKGISDFPGKKRQPTEMKAVNQLKAAQAAASLARHIFSKSCLKRSASLPSGAHIHNVIADSKSVEFGDDSHIGDTAAASVQTPPRPSSSSITNSILGVDGLKTGRNFTLGNK